MPYCSKLKFSIKDFFSKCDQIHGKPRIWSHLLKKSLMENFIFCVVISKEITFLYYYFFGQAYLQYGLYSLKKSIGVHFNRSNQLRQKCHYSKFFWSVFSLIQSKCKKIRTRKTPNTDTFYAEYDLERT